VNTKTLAFSVSQFCAAHNISRAFYYLLKKRGIAPASMKVGKRELISAESALEWRNRLTSTPLSSVEQRPAA
jgi:hypothetical protein